MGYRHTQRAPLGALLVLIAAVLIGTAWRVWENGPAGILLGVGAVVFLLLAASFWRLTVEDRGASLGVRFGPLPVFGTSIPYSSIAAATAGRSSLIDGWGIHFVPFRGWTFNLWGRSCVAIRTAHGVVRVGTDDPANLERFLKERMSGRA